MSDSGANGKARKSIDRDDFIILGIGLISCVATLLAARWLYSKDFAIITWLGWFIVPFGSILLGGLSVVGFMVGAVRKQKRISLFAGVLMIMILLPTYFAHYAPLYDSYAIEDEVTQEVKPLSEYMNFWEFYLWEMKSRVYVDTRATDEQKAKAKSAGNMGYLYALLEIVGFLLGGFGVLVALSSFRYCDKCSRYFSDKGLGVSTEINVADETLSALQSGDHAKVFDSIKTWKNRIPAGETFKTKVTYHLILKYCKSCYEETLATITARKHSSSEAKEIASVEISSELTKALVESDG